MCVGWLIDWHWPLLDEVVFLTNLDWLAARWVVIAWLVGLPDFCLFDSFLHWLVDGLVDWLVVLVCRLVAQSNRGTLRRAFCYSEWVSSHESRVAAYVVPALHGGISK